MFTSMYKFCMYNLVLNTNTVYSGSNKNMPKVNEKMCRF